MDEILLLIAKKPTQKQIQNDATLNVETKVMTSLQGEEVTVTTLDREENQYYGELLEINQLGVTLKYTSHGRDFIEILPMSNVNTISHKILDK